MLDIYKIIYILFFHFFADFVFQTDYWARTKNKNLGSLIAHVGTYSIIVSASMSLIGLDLTLVLLFCAITFIAHSITDFFSSKLTNVAFSNKNYHWGFVVVGADQFLHYVQLLFTFYYLA